MQRFFGITRWRCMDWSERVAPGQPTWIGKGAAKWQAAL
jgi:hypothetical protein